MAISTDRIIQKLDSYLHKNDYESAKRHLLYWNAEARSSEDHRAELLTLNELMGLYRKLGERDEALSCADAAMSKIDALGIGGQVGSATTLLNCATVYKAFSMSEQALPIFERARAIYEAELDENDERLGGLYNNMALALCDCKRFDEAAILNDKAIEVMKNNRSYLEVAITLLNMATAKENEKGIEDSCEYVEQRLDEAREYLDNWENKNGYYAFVCEKCATVYGYYGHFAYEKELTDRARRIYEGD